MADNYIAVNPVGSRHGSTLLQAVNTFASAKDTLNLLKRDMDQMTDGVSFTTIEAAFNVPAGKGQALYNLVAGAVSELAADTNVSSLIDYLGATR